MKSEKCNSKDYLLIHILEDEWITSKEKIKQYLNITFFNNKKDKFSENNYKITQISNEIKKEFLYYQLEIVVSAVEQERYFIKNTFFVLCV